MRGGMLCCTPEWNEGKLLQRLLIIIRSIPLIFIKSIPLKSCLIAFGTIVEKGIKQLVEQFFNHVLLNHNEGQLMYKIDMWYTVKTLLDRGKSLRCISQELGISRKTVTKIRDENQKGEHPAP
jgi:hypothetical protein